MKYNEKYGLYVTKNGLIFTVDRRYKDVKLKLLKPIIVNSYEAVHTPLSHGHKLVKVHKLVAETFIGTVPENKCIDHIDRNKLNNDISNLRWVTYSENANNKDKEKFSLNNSLGQINSKKKKRIPVILENVKTEEKFEFNSRFNAAKWLIETNQTTTKSPQGLARRIAMQKYVHGYKIYNINAERPAEMA